MPTFFRCCFASLCALGVFFVPLHVSGVAEESPEVVVWAAAEHCVQSGLHASGAAFATCVEQLVQSRLPAFPQLYEDYVRNFVCSRDDNASPPLRSLTMRLDEVDSVCQKPGSESAGATCVAAEQSRLYEVDIIREMPLIALVRRFASKSECKHLVRAGGREKAMDRAFVETNNKAGTSRYDVRRSYTSSIQPRLDDGNSAVTDVLLRMFGVARNLSGHSFFAPGQEPLSVNLYKDPGDEFRWHCDGPCLGEPYVAGERAASALLYCKVARAGGQTSFMKDSLVVSPAAGDLLFFTHRDNLSSLGGAEGVHSACPLRAGKKWAATQWFRELGEGMTAGDAENAVRHLRRTGRPPWIRGS